MIPVNTVKTTHYLGAPPDWNAARDGPCGALPAVVQPFDASAYRFLTFWRPTPEERAVIAAGGDILLQVIGAHHPPVQLDAVAQEPEKILHG
jgi:hypothetical protein